MNRMQRSQLRAEREFRQEQAKTPEERDAESLFRSIPRNADGSVTINDFRPLRDFDGLNDLMIPLNNRIAKK